MNDSRLDRERDQLIDEELRMLGVRSEQVLEAMRQVPREEFVPHELREFAYRNAPLPIGEGQTISQPLIVAFMCESLELSPNERVLEVGTGSGYAAAVLSKLAREVYTVERQKRLASVANRRLMRLGFKNVHVLHADGTLGWSENAPYDAIVVAAGGPGVPSSLLEQLRIGGRLLMPVGRERESQRLVRVVRRGSHEFEYEELEAVHFVPLVGEAGWKDDTEIVPPVPRPTTKDSAGLTDLIRKAAEPLRSPDQPDLSQLLNRIGTARLVLIGEATHGTSEFYRMRAAITRALVEQKGFDFVAVEADWPDAYRIHDFVTHRQREEPHDWMAFARFPTWMWRNLEVLEFIHWLRDYNLDDRSIDRRVGFYGLDMYCMYTSISRVLEYLDRVDPRTAEIARTRYGCLSPWEADPANYGRATLAGWYKSCESGVVQMLQDLNRRQLNSITGNGEALFDVQCNARLVAKAEEYYRVMYYGANESWNLRDTHMFETLQLLLGRYGPNSKAVVWEHNSHLGNAAATQFGKHGQINVGQLCRETYGNAVYAIGQGTDHGVVAAASTWEGPMELKHVHPSHADSYEKQMHLSEMEAFCLPLTKSNDAQLVAALTPRRLERAIGVIYLPETERLSHYFDASLPAQFDEWIWFDETSPVHALTTEQGEAHEVHHPFAIIDR